MQAKPIRIALIGCGDHSGRAHAAPLAHYAAEHPGQVELVAACDLDRERAESFVEKFGFAAAYTDMETMLTGAAPDGVVCVMRPDKTVPMAIELLRRGLPCTIEKPLGKSAAEAHELAKVAAETQTPHMLSMNRRHMPHLVKALQWLRDRPPLRFGRATMLRHERTEEEFIWGTAIHPLDTMVHIAGRITDYQSHVMAGGELSSKWYSLSLDFASGGRGELHVLPTCGREQESYELFGEDFSVRVSITGFEKSCLQCWAGGKLVVEESIDSGPAFLANGFYGEACAFVRSLRADGAMTPTVADVMPAMEICFELAGLGG